MDCVLPWSRLLLFWLLQKLISYTYPKISPLSSRNHLTDSLSIVKTQNAIYWEKQHSAFHGYWALLVDPTSDFTIIGESFPPFRSHPRILASGQVTSSYRIVSESNWYLHLPYKILCIVPAAISPSIKWALLFICRILNAFGV